MPLKIFQNPISRRQENGDIPWGLAGFCTNPEEEYKLKGWFNRIEMKEEYDQKEGYCRILGHYVEFKYCRYVNEELPCSRIIDCWFDKLPIQNFLQKYYTPNEMKRILTPPESKINTILDIVEKIKSKR